jgi:hypothetical protein
MLPPIHAHLNRLLELPTSMGIRVTTDESLLTVIRLLDGALQEAGVPDNKTYVSSNLFFANRVSVLLIPCQFDILPLDLLKLCFLFSQWVTLHRGSRRAWARTLHRTVGTAEEDEPWTR